MSDRYWTVSVQVNEVIPPEAIRDGNNYVTKVHDGPGKQAVVMTERQTIERFSTVVRAASEPEAYRKAIALMEINRPEEVSSGREANE